MEKKGKNLKVIGKLGKKIKVKVGKKKILDK